jgi:hypothetical protein
MSESKMSIQVPSHADMAQEYADRVDAFLRAWALRSRGAPLWAREVIQLNQDRLSSITKAVTSNDAKMLVQAQKDADALAKAFSTQYRAEKDPATAQALFKVFVRPMKDTELLEYELKQLELEAMESSASVGVVGEQESAVATPTSSGIMYKIATGSAGHFVDKPDSDWFQQEQALEAIADS